MVWVFEMTYIWVWYQVSNGVLDREKCSVDVTALQHAKMLILFLSCLYLKGALDVVIVGLLN